MDGGGHGAANGLGAQRGRGVPGLGRSQAQGRQAARGRRRRGGCGCWIGRSQPRALRGRDAGDWRSGGRDKPIAGFRGRRFPGDGEIKRDFLAIGLLATADACFGRGFAGGGAAGAATAAGFCLDAVAGCRLNGDGYVVKLLRRSQGRGRKADDQRPQDCQAGVHWEEYRTEIRVPQTRFGVRGLRPLEVGVRQNGGFARRKKTGRPRWACLVLNTELRSRV